MIPIDQSTREQVLNDTCNQIIHAGAGTGKTTLIVEKYLTLIEQGIDPEKIVAITFTHASADELKQRIALRYAQKFPNEAALSLAHLPINTIHGFARSIIRNESLQLGYLPSFVSTEEQAMDQLREQSAALFIPAYMKKHPNLFIWKLLGWIQSQHIQSWLILLSSQGRNVEASLQPQWHWDWQPILACIQSLADRLQQLNVPDNDSAAKIIYDWQFCFSNIKPDMPFTWAPLLEQKPIAPDTKGNQKNWGGKDSVAWVREELHRLNQAIDEFKSSLSNHLIQTMDAMNMDFNQFLSDQKKKKNWMEPDEQLSYATDLLSQETIWQEWKSRVDYIFIDEFQDTDPVQTTMIWRLLSESFSGKQDWTGIKLRPKSLTVVGDPQQSIYRFRGASVEIFDQACQSIQDNHGKLYTLSQNFRSNQGILDFVNKFFKSENSFVPLYAVPSDQEHHSEQLKVHSCPISGKDILNVDDLRTQEAHILYAKLEHFLRQNPSILPQHCALLLPTLKNAFKYQEAFQQHMPVNIQAKRGQPDILLDHILQWLRILQMPWKSIQAWQAFRLPWTYQSMQTLVDWHQKINGLALHKQHSDPAWQTVQKTIQMQASLLQQSCLVWAEHFFTFYQNCFSTVITASDIKILHWLIEQAYIYDTSQPGSSFISHLEQSHQLQGIQSSESKTSQALQIMTMHQSKGLEFPVVLLGDLASQVVKPQNIYRQPYPQQVELAFSSFREWLKTPEFDSMALREKKALTQEKKRLLYVAMTRAKNHLIYPTTDFSTHGQTFYNFFKDDLDPAI